MARFHASCSHAFHGTRVRTDGTGRMLASRAQPVPAVDPKRGPGWFDSSWDLQCGLDVREGLPEDVRLNEWIDVCLRS